MHTIGNYVFDSRRLILYSIDYSDAQRALIYDHFQSDDCFDKLYSVLKSWQNRSSMKRPLINEIGICLTNDCNLRCNYCSDSSVELHNDSLSKEMIFSFIAQAVKEKVIRKHMHSNEEQPLKVYFTGGGEPSYHWDKFVFAVQCIEEIAHKYNIPYSLGLTTNAILSNQQCTFIAEHFDTVMISYDGLPQVQRKNRKSPYGIDTNARAEKTISLLCQSNVNVTIRTTIWQDDILYLQEMADHLYQNFPLIHEWSIRPVLPAGRSYGRIFSKSDVLRGTNFHKEYLNVCHYIQMRYGKQNVSTPIFPYDINDFSCGALSPLCDCPWLMPDGSIVTCIETDQHKTEIGRVEGNNVIWYETCNDPLLNMYVRKFRECSECIAYRFCKGGCPIRHLRNEHINTSMSDWECDMIQEHISNLINSTIKGDKHTGWKIETVGIEGTMLEVLQLVKTGG